jgi:hypothetical protein
MREFEQKFGFGGEVGMGRPRGCVFVLRSKFRIDGASRPRDALAGDLFSLGNQWRRGANPRGRARANTILVLLLLGQTKLVGFGKNGQPNRRKGSSSPKQKVLRKNSKRESKIDVMW